MRYKQRPDRRRLAAIATRQHGVVSIRELEFVGIARTQVSREVASGRLHQVHRGVYAVGPERLTWPYWDEERFAVELDLFETHGTRASFESDRVRQEELMLIGVAMIRVTGPRLKREPEIVIERVRTLLERRRRPGG
jgi:Transcriptional regulator, AbiEi antitoxin